MAYAYQVRMGYTRIFYSEVLVLHRWLLCGNGSYIKTSKMTILLQISFYTIHMKGNHYVIFQAFS